jgi:hypothetical protein
LNVRKIRPTQYEHREHFWIGQQNVNKKMAGGICSAKNFGQNR